MLKKRGELSLDNDARNLVVWCTLPVDPGGEQGRALSLSLARGLRRRGDLFKSLADVN